MTIIQTLNPAPCTLLFVHGWAADSWVWKYQIKEFSKDYDVITVDLPGHGGKDRWSEPTLQPAVKKVLQLLTPNSKLRTYVGIGWSLGASVLMAASVKSPDLFKGLILTGATPCFVKKDDFPWAQPKGIAKRMLKDMKDDAAKTLSGFYPLNFTEEELKKRAAKEFIKYYSKLKTQNSKLISSLEALINIDMRNDIKKIGARTLIIHGVMDGVCPAGAGEYLAENIKGASFKVLKESGHAPFLTRAKEFNKEVGRFLKNL